MWEFTHFSMEKCVNPHILATKDCYDELFGLLEGNIDLTLNVILIFLRKRDQFKYELAIVLYKKFMKVH